MWKLDGFHLEETRYEGVDVLQDMKEVIQELFCLELTIRSSTK